MTSDYLFDYVRLAIFAVSVMAFVYELAMPVIRFLMLKADQESVSARLSAVEKRLTKGAEELKATQADLTKGQRRREVVVRKRDALLAEIQQCEKANFELVHEIGEAKPGARLFSGPIAVRPTFLQADERDVPFSREIWKHRNLAHALAPSEVEARRILDAAFQSGSGISVPAVALEPG